ncbi:MULTISPECIES: NAD(P)/FAD-dependent oxidoreductase [unclassified Oceanispirochaeta]|uniref:phytoene desaturase family protein n=1 Tax=unclassified Oceanispirochaeta TaxID=2635722 RepID=UPI000E09DD09|nr:MULTISPECIES: NAD(P)/FAD-dependent oxidoreductase [unclassified Oceanispirochaeta]MBF9018774.1 NAD(P)/FAD-dependent oxidoreductase [Oceanispirochaeta sp. M2]NPD75243.1 NAD(P)/FAD-dependent oxidoreductase [Oceanispirochaeta sp. M1]RDG28906.1 NAD(P)/FAD-dependent oxidoreductase [Oceanispirochaeta sp. M1]
MEKSIIIIGGGLSGLSAGCYGRMNGYRTSIFEMHSISGGVATGWKRKGYTIDGAMNTMMGTKPGTAFYKFWEELGATHDWQIANHDHYILLEDENRKFLSIYSDIDYLEQHMIEFAPEDKTVIREFCQTARNFKGIKLPVHKPQTHFGILDYIKMLKLMPYMRIMQKWSKISTVDYNKRFKNTFLRKNFGIRPEAEYFEMPALNLAMELAWLNQKDGGYVIGGALALSSSIERRYLKLGGELNLKVKVEKILVENDKAVGIKLTDGTEHRADTIISAADGHSTIFDMLDGKYVDDKIRGYYDNMTLYPPLVYVALGVDRIFDDIPSSVEGLFFPIEKPVIIAGKEHKTVGVQIYNFDPTLAPEGKTLIRVYFTTDYDYWERLYEEHDKYNAEKKQIADTVVAILDKRFPGLAAQVEMRDVATPMTWVRYTANWRGAYEGWMMTPRTFMMQMDKTLPGLDNFYMAGQWVNPGGSLPVAAMSGNHTIQIICKRDKKKFVTSTP